MGWTVAIGIDTHRDGHVAVALDRLGAGRGSLSVAADAGGYLALWRWALELGEPAFAVEGTGSYGAGLARFLVTAGAEVYECERPRRAERRRGKSDLIDATLAAGRLVSNSSLARVRGGGVRDELRLLLLERRGAVRARTAAFNQLQAVVVTAPESLRSRLRGLAGQQLARAAARVRGREGESAVLAGVLRRLARRVRDLAREIDELDRELEAIVTRLVPELLEEKRCRARLRGTAGRLQRRPQPHGQRGLVRRACRHQPRPGLQRTPPAPPPQPRRRPPTQPRPPRDRPQPRPLASPNRRLPPETARLRQNPTRSTPLHQTHARPPLPPPTTNDPRLDTIEASRAHKVGAAFVLRRRLLGSACATLCRPGEL
jgi:Transposase